METDSPAEKTGRNLTLASIHQTYLKRSIDWLRKSGYWQAGDVQDSIIVHEVDIKPELNKKFVGSNERDFLERTNSYFEQEDFGNSTNIIDNTSLLGEIDIFSYINNLIYTKVFRNLDLHEISQSIYDKLQSTQDPELAQFYIHLFPDAKSISRLFASKQSESGAALFGRRTILSYGLLIDYLEQHPDAPTDNQMNKIPLILYDMGLKQLVAVDPEDIDRYSEEYVMAAKADRLPPPSPNLRYSLQAIAHNEMPDGSPDENPRGNMGEFLMSIFNAANKYAKSGGGVDEIEVLINVNNDPGVTYINTDGKEIIGTLANARTVELLEALNSRENTDTSLARLTWISDIEDPVKQRTTREFYRKLLTKGKLLIKQGLSIQYIDCTDGVFITKTATNKGEVTTLVPTQGARRRLVASTAQRRLARARESQNTDNKILSSQQVMNFADVDTRYSANYFIDMAAFFSREPEFDTPLQDPTPLAVLTPARLVPDIRNKLSVDTVRQYRLFSTFYEFEKIAMKMYLDTQKLSPYRSNHPNRTQTIAPLSFSGSFSINAYAYELSEGWNIAKNAEEDIDFMTSIKAVSNIYHEHQPPITIIDRIRSESYAGNPSRRAYIEDIEKYYFRGEKKQIESFLRNYGIAAEVTSLGEFAKQIWKILDTGLNSSERALIDRFMRDNSYKLNMTKYAQQVDLLQIYQLHELARQLEQYPDESKYPQLLKVLRDFGRAYAQATSS